MPSDLKDNNPLLISEGVSDRTKGASEGKYVDKKNPDGHFPWNK